MFGCWHDTSQCEKEGRLRDGKQISYKVFAEIYLPYPPLPEQQKIASVLSKVDSQIEQNKNYLSHLQELKEGLVQDLLTGKVRCG